MADDATEANKDAGKGHAAGTAPAGDLAGTAVIGHMLSATPPGPGPFQAGHSYGFL